MKKKSSVIKHILPRLKDILRKKDIKIKKLKRLSGGVVNEVYLLNNKFILRSTNTLKKQSITKLSMLTESIM